MSDRPPPLPKRKPRGDAEDSERRRKPRKRLKGIRVNVTSPRALFGVAADISETGVYVELQRGMPIPVGREVQLQFQLPGQPRPFRARGEVVRHVGASGMGIRFLMLALDERNAIAAYVALTD